MVAGFVVGFDWRSAAPRAANDAIKAPADTGSGTASVADIDDPLTPVMSAIAAGGKLRDLARIGPLVDELTQEQMFTLMDKLEQSRDERVDAVLLRLLARWTKRDPDIATKWMKPRLARYAKDRGFDDGFRSFHNDLVRAWAENAPELAIEQARQHADTALAGIILRRVVEAWPDKDNARRFELVQVFLPGRRARK